MAKKVMIVDDESGVRATVKAVLESEGYEVSEAVNADDAWEKIQKNKPNLMLLDIMMPGLKAVDFIKKIKSSAKLKSIKIIFITAVMGAKEAMKKEKWVLTTIEKPFDNALLIAEVKEAVK